MAFMDAEEDFFYDAMAKDLGEDHKANIAASNKVTKVGRDDQEIKMPNLAKDDNEERFYDAEDYAIPQNQKRVMHLSLDYQQIQKWEKGRKPQFVSSSMVNAFLSDLDYNQLVGKSESFSTLACAVSTVERMQQLEALQPRLAWKPLDIIKKTIENTTQWGRIISQYPMKKHHISRFPWNNRRRLREEVAMDTIFMKTTGFDGSTCAQVYVGLMSRMLNVYPMPSKASGYILKSYQDFMRYEGVPEGLHRDLAPEEKVDKIIELNRQMMVKDSWSEQGHPNENPAESLGVNPLKKGMEQIMNRTGADSGAWPWACKYIAQINNICATPVHGWKTPISVRHGYTPDISAYLQFQYWEKVYFKIDEQSPESKEAPGYWLGVSETVGDLMTFDIWSDRTKRVIQRSAVRSADPNRGGIPNLRVEFEEDSLPKEEPEIVEPQNLLDTPGLTCPPSPSLKQKRTKKHKVRWHECQEAPEEACDESHGFHDAMEDISSDFNPKITTDDLDQSNPERRKKLKRSCRKAHLLTASAFLSLASASAAVPIIDSGCNFYQLEAPASACTDLFNKDNEYHILETCIEPSQDCLSHEAFVRKMQLQYFDALEDSAEEDWSFVPIGVLDHRVSITPRRKIIQNGDQTSIQVTKGCHVRVKTC